MCPSNEINDKFDANENCGYAVEFILNAPEYSVRDF